MPIRSSQGPSHAFSRESQTQKLKTSEQSHHALKASKVTLLRLKVSASALQSLGFVHNDGRQWVSLVLKSEGVWALGTMLKPSNPCRQRGEEILPCLQNP